jgi:N-acetylglucosamine-6-phosphate deacetylase
LAIVAKFAFVRFGTTALLPTLITDTPEITAAAIAAGIEAARRKVPGFAGLTYGAGS